MTLLLVQLCTQPSSAAGPADETLKGAVPLDRATALPSTADQYRALNQEIATSKPRVEEAKRKSDALIAETRSLRQQLAATAIRVEALENEKGQIDGDVAKLALEMNTSAAELAKDRVQLGRLLAVIERLQRDMPPAMVLRPDDALAASRGAMMLGSALPRIYKAAGELSRRVAFLRRTQTELIRRRAQSARNEVELASARTQLDQLLAMKSQEADEAAAQYGDLAGQMDAAADQAASLGALLDKVAVLRKQRPLQNVVVVAAENVSLDLRPGSLLHPVAGRVMRGDTEEPGRHLQGLSFLAPPGATVVAPADSQVLFAGPYHKTGQVLILETGGGYDLVLAGLERIDVRAGDALLAGEPLGRMPVSGESRLYFELRQNGKGVDPAPWLQVDLRKAKRL
jgi:septal ring factor EnvC (AmiA/AmiB activator)